MKFDLFFPSFWKICVTNKNAQEGYNLSNTCSSNSQSREDGADKVEVQICDRCNGNSKEQDKKREFYALAGNKF